VARQDFGELRRALSGTLRAILFLTIPASVGLFVLRVPLIRVLLERGEFTASSTAVVAWALQFYALGLPAYAAVEIVSRAFYALHDTRTPVLVGAATVALNVLLSLLLLRSLQHGGLALANALAVNVEMAALLWFMRRRLGSLDARPLLLSVGRAALAATLMGVVLQLLAAWMASASPWFAAVVGVGLGSLVYIGAAYLFRSSEMAALAAGFRWRLERLAK
jgi:putative peptidoglycan lipid II flippase